MGKSDYTFRYRIRSWPEYNRALVNRGRLTLWVDQDAIAAWRYTGPSDGRGPTEGLRRRGDGMRFGLEVGIPPQHPNNSGFS